MTGKDVYLQMTWSWPDKTWNILCSYCLQWNTSQSKFRNHYFLFYLRFPYCPNFFWLGLYTNMQQTVKYCGMFSLCVCVRDWVSENILTLRVLTVLGAPPKTMLVRVPLGPRAQKTSRQKRIEFCFVAFFNIKNVPLFTVSIIHVPLLIMLTVPPAESCTEKAKVTS